jgi:hypothetical protein
VQCLFESKPSEVKTSLLQTEIIETVLSFWLTQENFEEKTANKPRKFVLWEYSRPKSIIFSDFLLLYFNDNTLLFITDANPDLYLIHVSYDSS